MKFVKALHSLKTANNKHCVAVQNSRIYPIYTLWPFQDQNIPTQFQRKQVKIIICTSSHFENVGLRYVTMRLYM